MIPKCNWHFKYTASIARGMHLCKTEFFRYFLAVFLTDCNEKSCLTSYYFNFRIIWNFVSLKQRIVLINAASSFIWKTWKNTWRNRVANVLLLASIVKSKPSLPNFRYFLHLSFFVKRSSSNFARNFVFNRSRIELILSNSVEFQVKKLVWSQQSKARIIRAHPFRTYAKFFEKLTLLTP